MRHDHLRTILLAAAALRGGFDGLPFIPPPRPKDPAMDPEGASMCLEDGLVRRKAKKRNPRFHSTMRKPSFAKTVRNRRKKNKAAKQSKKRNRK